MSPRQNIRIRPGLVFDFNNPSTLPDDAKTPFRTQNEIRWSPSVGDVMTKKGVRYGPIAVIEDDLLFYGDDKSMDLDFWESGDSWEAEPNPIGRVPVGDPNDLMRRANDYVVWVNRGAQPFNAQQVETFVCHNIPAWVFVTTD